MTEVASSFQTLAYTGECIRRHTPEALEFSKILLFRNGLYLTHRQTSSTYKPKKPIPVAARSKVYACGRSLAGNEDSNPAGGMAVSLVSVVRCEVEASATGRSLAQRSPTECVCVS
jgi:hypothetical protein